MNKTVRCIYFKKSGKFYGDGELTMDFPDSLIYPSEFGVFLRKEKKLPGLSSGNWVGPFSIEVSELYTELVLPKEDIEICLSEDAKTISDLDKLRQTFDAIGVTYEEEVEGEYTYIYIHRRAVYFEFFADGSWASLP